MESLIASSCWQSECRDVLRWLPPQGVTVDFLCFVYGSQLAGYFAEAEMIIVVVRTHDGKDFER